ncbi:hypothetical protein [Halorubrum sp. AJ67]|uniref:hypothetical protein n=1 Tax=Halorubrum sp. AJ67 TaxID=1173487 RepID=UPI00064E3261|nr:hypothetical protein [Halorubrum sp. AJ67]
MAEVRRIDLENPWVFVLTTVVMWVVVTVTIQTVLSDGEWTGAVIRGAGGGFVCGITMFYLRKKDWF